MKRLIILSYFIVSTILLWADGFCLKSGQTVRISDYDKEQPIVKSAIEMLTHDMATVLDCTLKSVSEDTHIIVGTTHPALMSYCNDSEKKFLDSHKEGFVFKVSEDGKLVIIGSDSHGTAYGLLELSRLIGVSPWEWWADAVPNKLDRFELPDGYSDRQAPSVEYRGIFINDEDWGLMPWSSMTHEPENSKGIIGNETSRRIFELLLRLRANTYWPPMHECSEPFFLTPGNREIAAKYGIYIGGSHCEPMASSTAVEWGRRGTGEYDYVNNKANVLKFWENRVKDVANQEVIYTLGMRGIHDGAMNGAKTMDEKKSTLGKVISDQRELLKKYVNENISLVPQVFIPYKEVLDIYEAGLEVPDDVTLMWCDDNFGYVRHFPDSIESKRKAGNGIYYHVSYWGRPHDYLWLGTTSPALIFQQMSEAFDRGIQKMWILNVGDIKPAEYQIELFMDMAWNIDNVKSKCVSDHLCSFLKREFGDTLGNSLLPVLEEHYHLAFIRKPEFLGNTRTEEYDTDEYNHIRDLQWSDSYITNRLNSYSLLSDAVEKYYAKVPSDRQDTYFQLVKYPVQAANEMNKKMLYAQLARHGRDCMDKSIAAFDSIRALTLIYNNGIHNNGKWNGIMDYKPRNLPVFESINDVTATSAINDEHSIISLDGADCSSGTPVIHKGLGYSRRAAGLPMDESLCYNIRNEAISDSVSVKLKLLPNHPIDSTEGLRISVSVDDCLPVTVDYATTGRSEEWKENVLANQSVKQITLPVNKGNVHILKVMALTEGVILDTIEINN